MNSNKHGNITRRLALAGLLTAFALPSISGAATPLDRQPAPVAATDDDDPPCEDAVVSLEIDTVNGDVYRVDETVGLILTDNSLNVYFGALTSVIVDFKYTGGEWDVEVFEDGTSVGTYETSYGELRYVIYDDVNRYRFVSTEVPTGASAMNNMAPILPDVIIIPDKDCPPSP